MLVVAGAGDRITAKDTHAARLAEHFAAPLIEFPGGHLLQFGRRVGLDAMEALIRRQIRVSASSTTATST
jgi:hypothetical protein